MLGMKRLAISSREIFWPRSASLRSDKMFADHSSKRVRESTVALPGAALNTKFTRVASGLLKADGSKGIVNHSCGCQRTGSPSSVMGICFAPLPVVNVSPTVRLSSGISEYAAIFVVSRGLFGAATNAQDATTGPESDFCELSLLGA